MTKKDLALYGIQSNMLGAETYARAGDFELSRKIHIVDVLLANGSHLHIECDTESQSRSILSTLYYYPVNGNANNVVEFDFNFTLSYQPIELALSSKS